jgi:hypothetical protein
MCLYIPYPPHTWGGEGATLWEPTELAVQWGVGPPPRPPHLQLNRCVHPGPLVEVFFISWVDPDLKQVSAGVHAESARTLRVKKIVRLLGNSVYSPRICGLDVSVTCSASLQLADYATSVGAV